MGRQLPIVATAIDERQLLQFISTLSPIRVYHSFAESVAELEIVDWQYCDMDDFQFIIWIEAFPWQIEHKQTGGPTCPKKDTGKWYLANHIDAPVIELSRSPPDSLLGGRIYWANTFAAPDGLSYDAKAFARIVDRIWNWIRRNGTRAENASRFADRPYFLPDAWDKFRDFKS